MKWHVAGSCAPHSEAEIAGKCNVVVDVVIYFLPPKLAFDRKKKCKKYHHERVQQLLTLSLHSIPVARALVFFFQGIQHSRNH